MAGVAREALVTTIEHETRASIVIEIPLLPIARVVALLARRSQPTLVRVVLLVARAALARRIFECGCLVAVLARNLRVFAEQREPREPVIECGLGPTTLVMALLATVTFLALVFVILTVTRVARGIELLLIQIAGMARAAFHLAVFAPQRVAGVARVIERDLAPVALGVARLAFATELALVFVVLGMTAHARAGELLHVQRAGVAGDALDRAMAREQWIAGIAVVIKAQHLPIAGGVTALALGAEPALVSLAVVVLAMTAVAVLGRIFISMVDVARGAFRGEMFALESIPGLAVIETHLFPIRLDMTVDAVLTEAALVLVVLAMAAITIRRRGAMFCARLVTVAALNLRRRVTATQREVRGRVIESCRVEFHDVGLAPFMFGVTAAARGIVEPAVIAAPLRHVLRHRPVVVTAETEIALIGAFEWHVTVLAFALERGMAVNHLAGHDQRVQRTELGVRRRDRRRQSKQPEPACRARHRVVP